MDIALEKHNFKEINRLNQRGGRMLSIIDLLKDGTLDFDLAGFLLYSMRQDKSFLTAANPSGTGKTTLMGSLLGLLKPGIQIKTISNRVKVSEEREKNIRYLIHEIGDGPYFSYIWGQEVDKFLSLGNRAGIASCMHADSLEEMKDILYNPPLSVREKNFYNLDLILFMTMEGRFTRRKRRVSRVYGKYNNSFIKLFEWDSESDSFSRHNLDKYLINQSEIMKKEINQLKSEIEKARNIIKKIAEKDIVSLEKVRKEVIAEYKD
ncbi:MAG: hypothetical protein ACOC4G_11335 [Bacillota bacterium]